MAEGKQKKEADLDAILSEINATIKKEAKKKESEKKVEPKVTVKTEEKEEQPIQVVLKPQQEKSKSESPKGKKKNNKKKDPVVEATKDALLGNVQNEGSLTESRPARFIEVTSVDTDETQTEEQEIVIEKKVVDHDEISRERNPEMRKLRSKTIKRSKRQTRVAIIGAIMTIFCIIGVVASFWGIITYSHRTINNTAQKQELAKEIFPFVIIDIPEFSDPTTLDNAAIISSSIWKFIIDELYKSKYEKDDLGFTYVPAIDIEPYIRRLFGNDVKIQHQTVDDTSVQMNYDSETKVYMIESTPKFLPYRPRVDKISKNGDIFTLTVSYIMPDAMWELDVKDKVEIVGKTMEYQMKKNKSGYQLLSVKLISVEGISSGTPNQEQPPTDQLLDDEESMAEEQENQKQSGEESKETSSAQ